MTAPIQSAKELVREWDKLYPFTPPTGLIVLADRIRERDEARDAEREKRALLGDVLRHMHKAITSDDSGKGVAGTADARGSALVAASDSPAAPDPIHRIREWANDRGLALCPLGADTFGEGMRHAKEQVRILLHEAEFGKGATPPELPPSAGGASEEAVSKMAPDPIGDGWLPKKVRIVFDGPPGPPECGRFVEVKDGEGSSIRFGEWKERADGLWELSLDAEFSAWRAALWAERAAADARVKTVIDGAWASAALGGNDTACQGWACEFELWIKEHEPTFARALSGAEQPGGGTDHGE